MKNKHTLETHLQQQFINLNGSEFYITAVCFRRIQGLRNLVMHTRCTSRAFLRLYWTCKRGLDA